MNEPQRAAHRVAAVAERAWYRAGAGTDDGACVGVLAALALLGRAEQEGPDSRDRILACSDEEVAQLLREVWCLFTIVRPELAFRCGPFGEWLNSEPPERHLLAGAGAVARAAVDAGLLELTLDVEVSRQVDLPGTLYTMMRGDSAKAARGEFYTPPSVAELMAGISVTGLVPGQSICEPAAGTGGLLRAAAGALRAEGRDPGDYRWFACDISPIAVAGLAVNAYLWGLGHQVVIACANSLVEPDWEVRALREQRQAIETQRSRVELARALAVMTTPAPREPSP